MRGAITLKRTFPAKRTARKPRGRRRMDQQSSRVPRISRLMALAIFYDNLLREGVVADQAELAWLGHVSRARLTQIMNLLNLAPDLQEWILHLSQTGLGRCKTLERVVRPITASSSWTTQRREWNKLHVALPD